MTKRSERIKEFIDFIGECKAEHDSAIEGVSVETRRQEDILHAIEFCGDAKERSKLATKTSCVQKS